MLPEEVGGGTPPHTSSGRSIPRRRGHGCCLRRWGMLPEEVGGGTPPHTSSGSIPRRRGHW